MSLVEGVPAPSSPAPQVVGEGWDPGPIKTRKTKKSGKKSDKKAREPASVAEGRPEKHRHTKKLRPTKRLALELESLSGTLSDLRGRLTHLHTVQLGHRESTAALSRRVNALDSLTAGARDQGERLAARLDRLTQTVDALGARVAAAPAPDAALEDLAERISRAETALDRLQDQALAPETADRALGELEGRLSALQVLLDNQGGRLDRLAADLQVAQTALAPSEDKPWRGELEVLQRGLDGRLQGLAEGLRENQAEVRRNLDESRSWTRTRLARLGRRQTLVLGVVALIAGGLLAAQWWRTEHLSAGTSTRLETLAQALDTTAQGGPGVVTPPVAQDLFERLRRLESGLSDASRDLAATRQATEGSSARLTELAEGRQALVQRLDTLQRDLSGADKGLALLGQRVAGLTRPAEAAPAPRAPEVAPNPTAVPGYAIQLIAYQSRARVAPFVEQHGIGDRAVVTEARVGGRPAYLVLLGPFVSESEADQAMAALPSDLRALGPWVRRLSAGTRLEPWR